MQLRVRDDFFAYGQNGDDQLRAQLVEVGDDAHLKMGGGDDRVELSQVRVNDVGEIHGEHDFDVLQVDADTIDVGKLRVPSIEETLTV